MKIQQNNTKLIKEFLNHISLLDSHTKDLYDLFIQSKKSKQHDKQFRSYTNIAITKDEEIKAKLDQQSEEQTEAERAKLLEELEAVRLLFESIEEGWDSYK